MGVGRWSGYIPGLGLWVGFSFGIYEFGIHGMFVGDESIEL